MGVTVQLPLYHIHPAADLVVKGLHVLQQVQLTLGLRRRARLGTCVLASVRVCRDVGICGDVIRILVDGFGLYSLGKKKSAISALSRKNNADKSDFRLRELTLW